MYNTNRSINYLFIIIIFLLITSLSYPQQSNTINNDNIIESISLLQNRQSASEMGKTVESERLTEDIKILLLKDFYKNRVITNTSDCPFLKKTHDGFSLSCHPKINFNIHEIKMNKPWKSNRGTTNQVLELLQDIPSGDLFNATIQILPNNGYQKDTFEVADYSDEVTIYCKLLKVTHKKVIQETEDISK